VTVTELQKLASIITTIQIQWEETYGQYDVRQSISVATSYNVNCQEIEAISSIDFMKQLKEIVELRKITMSTDYSGEYNGGKGTLNSCYNRLLEIVEQGTDYNIAYSALNKELKSIGKNNYSFIYILELIDNRIPLHYLLFWISISTLITIMWFW